MDINEIKNYTARYNLILSFINTVLIEIEKGGIRFDIKEDRTYQLLWDKLSQLKGRCRSYVKSMQGTPRARSYCRSQFYEAWVEVVEIRNVPSSIDQQITYIIKQCADWSFHESRLVIFAKRPQNERYSRMNTAFINRCGYSRDYLLTHIFSKYPCMMQCYNTDDEIINVVRTMMA